MPVGKDVGVIVGIAAWATSPVVTSLPPMTSGTSMRSPAMDSRRASASGERGA